MERKTPLELGDRYFTLPKFLSFTLSALRKCGSPLSRQLISDAHWTLSERRTPRLLPEAHFEEDSFAANVFLLSGCL
jgi:hypothetical protein